MVSTASKNSLAQLLAIRVKAENKLNHFHELLRLSESQLRKKTIRVRNSLRKRPIKTISPTTRDSVIVGLSVEALRSTYKNIRKNTTEPISEGGLALYSPEELQKLLIAHRDTLKNLDDEVEKELKENVVDTDSKQSPSSTQKPKVDDQIEQKPTSTSKTTSAPPHDSPSSDSLPNSSKQQPSSANAGSSASRTGLSADTGGPSGQNLEDLMNDASDENQSDSDMKSVEVNTFTIRPKIFGKRLEGDFPALARQFFTKIKSFDDSAVFIPLDGSAQNVIHQASKIPDDIEQSETWIAEMTTTEKWKYFVFKIRSDKEYDFIRGKIFKWMGEIKCYTKVDLIRSEKISCLGFLANFHPEFHNRDRIATHLHVALTEALNTKTYVSVFARPIHAGKGLHRSETDAVIIEAAQDQAAVISQQLYSLPLDTYSDVIFVPFTKMDKSYTTTLKNVLNSNSKYVTSMEELNIPNLSFFNFNPDKNQRTSACDIFYCHITRRSVHLYMTSMWIAEVEHQ